MKPIGHSIQYHETIDSTNTYAMGLAHDPSNHGAVIVAERQTAGRGQYGRIWQCPPGSGILMSVLLFPPPALRRAVLLTALAAVSVAETIHKATGLAARIKWPNDILMNGRKVSGILIEQGPGVVVGIGLNVNQTEEDFRELGLPEATSLALQSGRRHDSKEVLRMLIEQLDDEYGRLLAGESTCLEAAWKGKIGLLGEQVAVVKLDGSTVSGQLQELSFDGLLLITSEGEQGVPPELVRHIVPMGPNRR